MEIILVDNQETPHLYQAEDDVNLKEIKRLFARVKSCESGLS